MRIILSILFLLTFAVSQAQHPIAFFNNADIVAVKSGINKYPLLTQSFNSVKAEVDAYLGKSVDVPFPKDPAGGYTHDRHKNNYMLMFNSGVLYNITGKVAYATLVKEMLLKYAVLNPTLKNHPQATSASPGHLFWQALNDANWMVYSGLAYDLIYNSLTPTERTTIEDGAFKPEVDFVTKDLKTWFDLLHNHAVWACAGVGIIGIATNNNDYVEMALKGSDKNGKSGFIAQMNHLFSPDGYYTEGPYYVRYAILPYILFANALNNTQPGLQIFKHRNNILQKALLTCLQQTNLDGTFFPLNDDIKDKNYTTNELVTAIDIAWKAYGPNEGLLTVAKKQNRVILHRGGADIAAAIATRKNIPNYFPYKTIESTDGINGDEGGVSVLRVGKNDDLTSMVFKYTAQGMGHGHFDKLNINLFDKGNEILQDYGSARFIGIEQKYGGRYLPENTSYASQTIAHNTLVVDEESHFKGDSKLGEAYHSEKLFSSINNPNIQYTLAAENNAYPGVAMKRGIYVIVLPNAKKIVVDLFNVNASATHQYDLPFQYKGQFISTNYKYTANTKKQETLGTKAGYQFLWKVASAQVKDTVAQFTFLNKQSYYTVSSLIKGDATILFTNTGANDPNFNIRTEPSMIIRKSGSNECFVNVVEIHGNYDPVNEFSSNSYSSVSAINLLENNQDYTAVAITIAGKKLQLIQSNKDFSTTATHQIKNNQINIKWVGPYTVLYDGKSF
ncbi:alginate lyase family protein [Ferruginibacter yonginensis]